MERYKSILENWKKIKNVISQAEDKIILVLLEERNKLIKMY